MHTLIGGAAAKPVRHAPQRARHAPLHADRARALPEAPRRGRARARLRDRPLLPQRGHQHAAQPRVHDARVLPGVRDVRRPDGLHRGAAARHRRAPRRGDAGRARRVEGARGPSRSTQPFARVPMDRAVAAAAERTAIPAWLAAVEDGGGAGARRAPRRRTSASTSRSGRSRRPAPRPSTGATFARRLGKCDSDGERLFALLRVRRRAVPGRRLPHRRTARTRCPCSSRTTRSRSRRSRAATTRTPSSSDRFELFVHGRELVQRLQRAQRSGRPGRTLPRAGRAARRAATKRRWTTTRTTSARSSTGCRRRRASAWASIGSSWR